MFSFYFKYRIQTFVKVDIDTLYKHELTASQNMFINQCISFTKTCQNLSEVDPTKPFKNILIGSEHVCGISERISEQNKLLFSLQSDMLNNVKQCRKCKLKWHVATGL